MLGKLYGKNSIFGLAKKEGLVFIGQMLLVKRRGGISKSYVFSLSQGSHALAAYFRFFWCSMGDVILLENRN